MVDGTAHRPFIYRTLIPKCARLVERAVPHGISARVNSIADARGKYNNRLSDTCKMLKWNPHRLSMYLIVIILQWMCLIGFAIIIRRLIKTIHNLPEFMADLLPVVALLLLTLGFVYGLGYIYDPSTLFFMTLGLYLIIKRRFMIFYPVLALALLNKETAFLLTVFFFLHELRLMRPGKLALHTIVQIALIVAIQSSIRWNFRFSPGSTLEYHLMDNILKSSKISLLYIVTIFIIFWIPVKKGWASAPAFLRHSLIAGLVFLIPGWIMFCRLAEVRDFLEIYPIAFLIMVPFIANIKNSITYDAEDVAKGSETK
ncbi:MAG: hypothetical protein WC455_12035 [Dehalococcoidia bacterium]|jgi:hypothetical protein